MAAKNNPIKITHPGKLTAAAERAGESISQYAKSHMHDPNMGAAARLYENVLAPANRKKKEGHWSGK